MRKLGYTEKGFTLIELLIVVAILGMLMVLVIPNVVTFLTSGNIGAGRAERSNLQTAVDGMMADAGVATWAGTTGWDGNTEGVVTVDIDGVVYDAAYYIKREVDPGSLWNVKTDGEVICTQYDNNDDEDFLAKINE